MAPVLPVLAGSLMLAACLHGCGGAPAPTPTLANSVSKEGQAKTLQAFEDIAKRHVTAWSPKGSRDRFIGYNESRDYILEQLNTFPELKPQTLWFPDKMWKQVALPELSSKINSVSKTYQVDTDFIMPLNAGIGSVSGVPVVPDDGSGCNASSSYSSPLDGKIVVLELALTVCRWCDQLAVAAELGAVGAIYHFTEEYKDYPLRGDPLGLTYENLFVLCNTWVEIPILTSTFDVAQELSTADEISLVASGEVTSVGSSNVCVDLPGGDTGKVIVIGAHLDSVPGGPGINDDGSGSALVLEIVRAFGQVFSFSGTSDRLKNSLRACWFGSEEWGLFGSKRYMEQMEQADKDKILGYFNVDMAASPNGANLVFSGDTSNPKASNFMTDALVNAFGSFGQNSSKAGLLADASDHASFRRQSIPISGLFAGVGPKTEEHAKLFGGTAGAPYDPCYHLACDDFSNADMDRQFLFSKVLATVIQQFVEDDTLAEHLTRENFPFQPAPPLGATKSLEHQSWFQQPGWNMLDQETQATLLLIQQLAASRVTSEEERVGGEDFASESSITAPHIVV